MTTSPPGADATSPPVIRASGLEKRYGDVRAVDGVGFEVRRGELVGFLGPNGAGKTTTMKMLTGYLYPDSGEVSIGGERLDGPGRLAARARIGYLPERTPLYEGMRVDRYLAFVGEVRGLSRAARRDAVARTVAACDLDEYATRRIRTLSKGYRQRVGLAQALVTDPEVLVLDEPTSGLDPVEIVRIRDLVTRLSEQKTILLSTHVLSEVEEVCGRVLILAAGRLVADGPLLELGAALEAEEGEGLVVVLGAPEEEAREALAAVPGVRSVDRVSRSGSGRLRFALTVSERFEVAPRIDELAHARNWTVFELRHEGATLERVFLARTRGLLRRSATEASA